MFLAIHVGMSQSRPKKNKQTNKEKQTNKPKNRTTCELLLWANDIKLQFKKLLKTVINEYFNGLLKLHVSKFLKLKKTLVCIRMLPVCYSYASICYLFVSVYPVCYSCVSGQDRQTLYPSEADR